MTSPLDIQFSDGTQCSFDVYVNSEIGNGKVRFSSTVSWDSEVSPWSMSFTEDNINDYASACCLNIIGSEYTVDDTVKVCALFFMILAKYKENKLQ